MFDGSAYTAQQVLLEVEVTNTWTRLLHSLQDLNSLRNDLCLLAFGTTLHSHQKQTYIWTSVVTTENNNVMSRHFYTYGYQLMVTS